MPILFRSRPGSVVALEDFAVQCQTRFIALNPGISYDSDRSLITRVTVGMQVNIQFLHSMGAQVYVYVFGDRMGQISLSGLSFVCECPTGVDLGGEKMLMWYKKNRASRRKQPVRITIGRIPIDGFVTAFTEDVVDPSLNLVQWGVTIQALPDDEGDGPPLTSANVPTNQTLGPPSRQPPLFGEPPSSGIV